MSARFKVGDLVVRNPEARGESGWPYDDAVCRVVGYYPNQNGIIVVPVNSPPNKRLHDCGWVAERFAPAAIFDPCPARRNDPPTSKVAALAMVDFVEGPITALRTALAEQPAEQESVQDEYNRVINHAIEQGIEASVFLRCWRDGDWSGCAEFGFEPNMAAYTAPQPTKPAEQEPVRGEWQGYTWNPYAVSQPKAEPLTDEEIYECERIAAIRYHRHKNSIRGQQLTPADDPQWHFARAIIAAYERKNGIGEQP